MSVKVKVNIDDGGRLVKLPKGIKLLIRRCCHAVLELEQYDSDAIVSVKFVTDEEIRDLNRKFRRIDKSTDVLSFPMGEGEDRVVDPDTGAVLLGDIVISIDTARRQAEEFGHSLQREIGFLTVHSMLHLLGYDHVDGGLEQVRMREKEETVLANLGYSRDTNYYDGEIS